MTDKMIETPPRSANPEEITPAISRGKESRLFGPVGANDFKTYIGAMVYGLWENARAMGFTPPPGGVNIGRWGPVASRASEGVQKLFDQNTGGGTIAALGFIGADVCLLMADDIGKKLGKKGFDPTIRFLSSLTFGVALASYLETTKFMNNTVDIPGDLFGVALGAAFILTSKVAGDRLTTENLYKLHEKTSTFVKTVPPKLRDFSQELATKLREIKDTNDPRIKTLSRKFIRLIGKNYEPEEQPLDLAE